MAFLRGFQLRSGPLPGGIRRGVSGSKSAFFTHTIPRRPVLSSPVVLFATGWRGKLLIWKSDAEPIEARPGRKVAPLDPARSKKVSDKAATPQQ